MIEKNVEYRVEKSNFPEGNKTHLVVKYSKTPRGYGYGRVFKGTFKECQKYRDERIELMKKAEKGDKNVAKRKNSRIFRKK